MITVVRLQEERQRALASGARPGRGFDFAAAMAEMRDQGLDPHGHPTELIFGPASTLGGGEAELERFVFLAVGSRPPIEIEIELLPGQLEELEWRPLVAPGGVRDRVANLPPGQ